MMNDIIIIYGHWLVDIRCSAFSNPTKVICTLNIISSQVKETSLLLESIYTIYHQKESVSHNFAVDVLVNTCMCTWNFTFNILPIKDNLVAHRRFPHC